MRHETILTGRRFSTISDCHQVHIWSMARATMLHHETTYQHGLYGKVYQAFISRVNYDLKRQKNRLTWGVTLPLGSESVTLTAPPVGKFWPSVWVSLF